MRPALRYRGRPGGAGAELAAFSFHPRKLVTTGEGGMVTTSDEQVAARLRRLREHGMDVSAAERHRSRQPVIEQYVEVGYNYRMTDVQAAIGLVQLGKLGQMVSRRRELAERYQQLLADIPGLRTAADPAYGTPTTSPSGSCFRADFPVSRDDLLALSRRPGSRPGVASWLHTSSLPTPAHPHADCR